MVPSIRLLPMATNYDWLGGARYNGPCCNGDGRSRPTVPSNHVHLHCYRLAWVLCHRSRRGSKLSIFETHRHCDALTELILTHRAGGFSSFALVREKVWSKGAEVRASAALKKRVREVCAYADGVCGAARDAIDRVAKRQLVDWHSSSWARAWSEAFAARRAGILSRATAVPRQL